MQNITISWNTVFKLAAGTVAVFFLYSIRDIALLFFAAAIFAIIFDKPIDSLSKKNISRTIATIAVYLFIFLIVGTIFYFILPSLATQFRDFARDYSLYFENIARLESKIFKWSGGMPAFNINIQETINNFADLLSTSAQTFIGAFATFFGGIFSFVLIFFIAMFLNIQENGARNFIFAFVPKDRREYVTNLFNRVQESLGYWLWGKIISSAIVGLVIFLGLYFLGIQYSLSLGVLAFLMNFIIFIGPIFAAIPAIALAFLQSPLLALIVAGFYVFVTVVLENFVVTPIIMKRAVGLNLALLVLTALIGGRIAGALGVVLAIPTAVIGSLLFEEHANSSKFKTHSD